MTPFVLAGELSGLGPGDAVEVDTDVDNHLRRVLRLQTGDAVEVTDGLGRVAAAKVTKHGLSLTDDVYVVRPREPGLTVLQALAKGRKHDEVVRVLTELGVERIVALSAENSISVLRGDKADRVRGRWAAVAASAVQQSRNAWAPEIDGPVGIELAVDQLPEDTLLLVADTTPDAAEIRTVLTDDEPQLHVALAIGPESGWTDDERNLWRMLGAVTVTLGPTVLRTEHAAVVGIAAVAGMTGRLAG